MFVFEKIGCDKFIMLPFLFWNAFEKGLDFENELNFKNWLNFENS
jgi:hypothetical protein